VTVIYEGSRVDKVHLDAKALDSYAYRSSREGKAGGKDAICVINIAEAMGSPEIVDCAPSKA
jgi:hypothetical protein